MKRLLSKLAVVGSVVTVVAISFSFSAQGAEKKKIMMKTTSSQILYRTVMHPTDVPNHELSQWIIRQTRTHSDLDWNMEAMIYPHWDNVAGSGTHRGYAIYHHQNGEEGYVKFEGTCKLFN